MQVQLEHRSPPRTTTASRSPPILPPGMPVKSGHFGSFVSSQQQTSSGGSSALPATGVIHKVSNSDLKQSATGSDSSHMFRRPSPPSSTDSHGPPSRTNSRFSFQKRGSESSRGSVEGCASPESDLVTPREVYTAQVDVVDDLNAQFEHLLDSLQVPSSVRQKFSVVSSDVKSSILSSNPHTNPSLLSSLNALPAPAPKATPKAKKRMSGPILRRAKSSSSLESPGPNPEVGKTYGIDGEAFVIVASPTSAHMPVPIRGTSMDQSRPVFAGHSRRNTAPRPNSLFSPSSSSTNIHSVGKSNGKGLGITMAEQPEAFVNWLKSHKGTELSMDVNRCKKLRMLLRHESTIWVGSFVELGGYDVILARLQDLFDIEWREEQHDDQMLYELLRCVKALSTSEVGKEAIRSSFPRPFPALSGLIFSEKKPGDIATRQIIIELWQFLYDLYPHAQTAKGRPSAMRFDDPSDPPVDVTGLLRSLLVPDHPDPAKEHHEFITQSHRPKIFKAWVQELSDICRDYFWIMCHGSNTLWNLAEVDERLVEKPVAPGGATGGVEFEAMGYVASHFRLLNTLCAHQAQEDPAKATVLHGELLTSGMDRILVTMRKASTTYYPTLHLELARYVSLLKEASPNRRLPHLIDKMVGSPPDDLRKRVDRFTTSRVPPPIPGNQPRRGSAANAK